MLMDHTAAISSILHHDQSIGMSEIVDADEAKMCINLYQNSVIESSVPSCTGVSVVTCKQTARTACASKMLHTTYLSAAFILQSQKLELFLLSYHCCLTQLLLPPS
jgi:hypothetical protein